MERGTTNIRIDIGFIRDYEYVFSNLVQTVDIVLMEENPAPVDRYSCPLSTRFCTFQVMQDFFHQQYV